MHHICDDHDFCTHEPIVDEDREKMFLSSSSGTMEELRQIVLDPAWMKSLAYYTRNRHTGSIEVMFYLMIIIIIILTMTIMNTKYHFQFQND